MLRILTGAISSCDLVSGGRGTLPDNYEIRNSLIIYAEICTSVAEFYEKMIPHIWPKQHLSKIRSWSMTEKDYLDRRDLIVRGFLESVHEIVQDQIPIDCFTFTCDKGNVVLVLLYPTINKDNFKKIADNFCRILAPYSRKPIKMTLLHSSELEEIYIIGRTSLEAEVTFSEGTQGTVIYIKGIEGFVTRAPALAPEGQITLGRALNFAVPER